MFTKCQTLLTGFPNVWDYFFRCNCVCGKQSLNVYTQQELESETGSEPAGQLHITVSHISQSHDPISKYKLKNHTVWNTLLKKDLFVTDMAVQWYDVSKNILKGQPKIGECHTIIRNQKWLNKVVEDQDQRCWIYIHGAQAGSMMILSLSLWKCKTSHAWWWI